jgi:hypothetical protein
MIIKAYGLLWRADQIEWMPGRGTRNAFDLCGRNGTNCPVLRVADFRKQRGVYILYGKAGPYYVGLTKAQTLGKRLRDHLEDHHAREWDRFSWFGFLGVLKSRDDRGFQKLRNLPAAIPAKPTSIIGDIEALLIKTLGTVNVAQMRFAAADEWKQIKRDEREGFFKKVNPD